MKEGWTYKKLGEICEIKSGKSIKAAYISPEAGLNSIPCYGGNGIRGYVSKANQAGNNPIIGRVGAQCGNVHFCREPFYATEHALVVAIKNTSIYPKWLCNLLVYMDLKQYAEGAAQPVIAASRLTSLSIGVPPLSEQQRIVSYLDSAFAQIDELKAKAEKQLSEAKALFQKALSKAMEPKEGWENIKLGKFAYMKAGDFVKASDIYKEYKEGLFPCYGGNGLRGYVKTPNQNGDFCLIGRQGALCGCINRAQGIFRTTEHAVIVKPYRTIPVELVFYILLNANLNQYATGAAQPGLSVNNIAESVNINVPPKEQYKHIVYFLESFSANIKSLETNLNKITAECAAFKQSILRQVFE